MTEIFHVLWPTCSPTHAILSMLVTRIFLFALQTTTSGVPPFPKAHTKNSRSEREFKCPNCRDITWNTAYDLFFGMNLTENAPYHDQKITVWAKPNKASFLISLRFFQTFSHYQVIPPFCETIFVVLIGGIQLIVILKNFSTEAEGNTLE